MPRYFFSARDGADFPDNEGTVLPDDESARVEAVKIAGQLLEEDAERFWDTASFTLTVSDESGATLFLIDTGGVQSPLARR